MTEKEEKYLERVEVLEKIKSLEKAGGENFFHDVENDPPFSTLKPQDVDYLRTKLSSKIKSFIATLMVKNLKKMATKRFKIEILGADNLQNLKNGAIVTTNHFSRYESLCVMKALDAAKIKRRMHIVVREGNFFMPGGIGFILKHNYTMPLSSSAATMLHFYRATSKILKENKLILMYPEQSMWWNYRKPKEYKVGAYAIACSNNVPIVPMFVTMKNIEGVDEYGMPNQKYTVHVMPPIYKDPSLSSAENAKLMLQKNHELCKNKYEEVYAIPLKYDGSNFLI